MVTLTLLDGTRVKLARPKSAAVKRARLAERSTRPRRGAHFPSAAEALTASDLVAAPAGAVAHGADATEILGENPRWEAMFSALLAFTAQKAHHRRLGVQSNNSRRARRVSRSPWRKDATESQILLPRKRETWPRARKGSRVPLIV